MIQLVEPVATSSTPTTEVVNHWIGGRRVPGRSGRRGPVYNPATGQVARVVDFASLDEVDAAVAGIAHGHDGVPQPEFLHSRVVEGHLVAGHGREIGDHGNEITRDDDELAKSHGDASSCRVSRRGRVCVR